MINYDNFIIYYCFIIDHTVAFHTNCAQYGPPIALSNIITSINIRSPDHSEVARKAKAMTVVMGRALKRSISMRESVTDYQYCSEAASALPSYVSDMFEMSHGLRS